MRCLCLIAAISGLLGCGDFQERLAGYPAQDTVVNVETATPNEIANALSQLARIAVLGDDWEFLDPDDACTVHVLDKSARQQLALNLRSATFDLKRDPVSKQYYATMLHASQPVLGPDQTPLRLFETDAYHDVFFAEGYLQALAKKCQQSLAQADASLHSTQ